MTDQERENEYLEMRRNGYGPQVAARLLGTTAREMAGYMALNPAFGDAVAEAIAESLEKIEQKVIETAQDGDMQAARFVLESHKPSEWIKPDREVVVRLGLDPASFDLPELTRRLELAHANAIDAESEEVDPDDFDNSTIPTRDDVVPERGGDSHSGPSSSDAVVSPSTIPNSQLG